MKQTAISLLLVGALTTGASSEEIVPAFVRAHCADCHDAQTNEGRLDLTSQAFNLSQPDNFALWVKVHDRVEKGEMPPADAERPEANAAARFRATLAAALTDADRTRVIAEGRATGRRMNRYEYENTLRDLLSLPYLRVKDFLPEDSLAHGGNKVGDALDVSHVQMARYLSGAEFALREAMVPQAEEPQVTTARYYAWDQRGMYKKAGPPIRDTFLLSGYEVQPPRLRRRGGFGESAPTTPPVDPQEREKQSVAILTSTFEPTEIQFNGFRAPFTARYRLTFSCFTIWMATDYKSASRGRRHEPVS
ncbi:MAG: DUF1587 domain-containing protein, partial [Planctomycetes bacterium]|nr:DUF1587 domain-containing protein [Planctomycetota bacterium]